MTYTIKLKNEQKWLASRVLMLYSKNLEPWPQVYKNLENQKDNWPVLLEKLNLSSIELKNYMDNVARLSTNIDAYIQKLKSLNASTKLPTETPMPQYIFIRYPGKKTCTKLSEAFEGVDNMAHDPFAPALEFAQTLQAAIKDIEELRPLLMAFPHDIHKQIASLSTKDLLFTSPLEKQKKIIEALSADFKNNVYGVIRPLDKMIKTK